MLEERIATVKLAMSGAAFSLSVKRYNKDRKRIVLDDFDMEALQCTVHNFYREKKYSMLDSILEAARVKGLFNGVCNFVESVT